MTALSAYDRLEASGLWRSSPHDQRRDVIVSIGEATLTITDLNDQPLAHWSIPAIERSNPGQTPAYFHPDGDPGEVLELPGNETEMIKAIETLRIAVDRARPHPGRLRTVGFVISIVTVIALCVFWLPGAVLDHTVSVVPKVKRQEVGTALLAHIRRVAGRACDEKPAVPALAALSARLPSPEGPAKLIVLRGGVQEATHLPGGIILLNKALFEDYEEPDVAAGFIIAEHLRAKLNDPLRQLLEKAGLISTIRLLTTGALPESTLEAYSEHLLSSPPEPVDDATLLAGFEAWSVRATPYAYAIDITGEKTLGLIEADPFATQAPDALISDSDWLRLQNICGG